jgi:hypothetical protein
MVQGRDSNCGAPQPWVGHNKSTRACARPIACKLKWLRISKSQKNRTLGSFRKNAAQEVSLKQFVSQDIIGCQLQNGFVS